MRIAFILWLVVAPAWCELLSTGLAVGASFSIASLFAGFDYFKCKWYECCNDNYIPNNVTGKFSDTPFCADLNLVFVDRTQASAQSTALRAASRYRYGGQSDSRAYVKQESGKGACHVLSWMDRR